MQQKYEDNSQQSFTTTKDQARRNIDRRHILKINQMKETKLQKFLKQIDAQFQQQMQKFLINGKHAFMQRTFLPTGISIYEDVLFMWSFKQQQQNIHRGKNATIETLLQMLERQTCRRQATIRERVFTKLSGLNIQDFQHFMRNDDAIHFTKKKLNSKRSIPISSKDHLNNSFSINKNKQFDPNLKQFLERHVQKIKIYIENLEQQNNQNNQNKQESQLKNKIPNKQQKKKYIFNQMSKDITQYTQALKEKRKKRMTGLFFFYQKKTNKLIVFKKHDIEKYIARQQQMQKVQQLTQSIISSQNNEEHYQSQNGDITSINMEQWFHQSIQKTTRLSQTTSQLKNEQTNNQQDSQHLQQQQNLRLSNKQKKKLFPVMYICNVDVNNLSLKDIEAFKKLIKSDMSKQQNQQQLNFNKDIQLKGKTFNALQSMKNQLKNLQQRIIKQRGAQPNKTIYPKQYINKASPQSFNDVNQKRQCDWSFEEDEVLLNFRYSPNQNSKEMKCLLRYKSISKVLKRYDSFKLKINEQTIEILKQLQNRGNSSKHSFGSEVDQDWQIVSDVVKNEFNQG